MRVGADEARWRKAQAYELRYWRGVAEQIAAGVSENLTWYPINAEKYRDAIVPHLKKDTAHLGKVVEVGSGPIGIVSYWGVGTCYATDPLDEFYRSMPRLSALRTNATTYLTGTGESLPFADGDVDIVIMENVLDHTRRPDLVLDEARRVLAPDGVMFFKVNVRTRFGRRVHRVLSRLNIDQGHPHSFSADSIRAVLNDHGFTIRHEEVSDYRAARKSDLSSNRLRDQLKGLLGVSQFWFTAVCCR